jgi:hypothetical protein
MNTCSISEAKGSLGRLADEALKGKPTVITRGGKLVILQSYEPPNLSEFDRLIQVGMESEHFPVTEELWGDIRHRGRKLARSRQK